MRVHNPNSKEYMASTNLKKLGFRPFVGLDGCHLNGRFGGQLLATIIKDGNDDIFAVAIIVVEQGILD